MDPHAGRYGRLALAGIAAQVLLVACAWALPSWSRFGLVDDRVGELVHGRHGWATGMALLLGSLGTIAIATAVRGLTRGTRGSKAGAVLLGLSGGAGILAAVFPSDELRAGADVWAQSLTGRLHLVAMGGALLLGVAGVVVLARVLTADPRWRALTPWPVLLATAAFSLLLAATVAQATGSSVGLLQRLLLTVLAGWLVPAAARAWQLSSAITERIAETAHEDSEILAEIAAELEHPVRR